MSAREAEKAGAVQNDQLVRDFVDGFLRVDGAFLLRLIAHNTSGITATEVTKEMWDLWDDERVKRLRANDATEIKTAQV